MDRNGQWVGSDAANDASLEAYQALLIGAWEPLLKLKVGKLSEGARNRASSSAFGPMLISPADIEGPGIPPLSAAEAAAAMHAKRAAEDAAESLAGGLEAAGARPPFASLSARARLSAVERDLLLLSLLQEIDGRFERFYGYLNDNAARPYLTIGLALDLLKTAHGGAAGPSLFSPAAPLFGRGLLALEYHESYPQGGAAGFIHAGVRMDRACARYLATGAAMEAAAEPARAEGLAQETRDQLAAVAMHVVAQDRPALIDLRGEFGAGEEEAAGFFAERLGRGLLILDLSVPADLQEHVRRVERTYRDAFISGCAVLVRGAESVEEHPREQKAWLLQLARVGVPTLVHASARARTWWRLKGMDYFRLDLSGIDLAARRSAWEWELAPLPLEAKAIESLAVRFEFTPGQITEVANRVKNALLQSPRMSPAEAEDALFKTASNFEISELDRLALRIVPRFEWSDLVLPDHLKERLREIVSRCRHRELVYNDWGYGRKVARNKGINALFYGESGTGKTMAAEVLGKELRLDVYKVDLSRIISKYIGETEKNLDRVFQEAEKTEVILFFDEADALFSKRTEVKDAHDRHANVETSYLLQKMEEYRGLVILATNFPGNIDKAFFRRFHFSVGFVLPEPRERLEIWRKVIPCEVPRAADVDLEFLSQRVKLSGGNIRNAALSSAFYAAESGRGITMAGLLKGVHREMEKSGKLVSSVDFGTYQPIINAIK